MTRAEVARSGLAGTAHLPVEPGHVLRALAVREALFRTAPARERWEAEPAGVGAGLLPHRPPSDAMARRGRPRSSMFESGPGCGE